MNAGTTAPAPIPFGIPYKTTPSVRNADLVRHKRFPAWAPHCEPYVNVLTLKAWNQRGFRMKKGEKAIRVPTLVSVFKEDEETGERAEGGTRRATAYVFALPQVERR